MQLATGQLSASTVWNHRGLSGRNVVPVRSIRKAECQVSGFQPASPLSEKVMNSARPLMFSTGIAPPRPPSSNGKRLSELLSRLSPITKT